MDINQAYAVATGQEELVVNTIHVRVGGKSHDIPFGQANIRAGMTDDEVKFAVSNHLDIAVDNFKGTIIERHANGNLSIRPQAVFGV